MTRDEAIEILNEIIDEGWLISDFEKCTAIDACEMAIEALEQEPTTKNILALLEKTYADLCNSEGGEGWLKIDGKEYTTDAGYALEGMSIFMEVFKRRLAELSSVTPQEPILDKIRAEIDALDVFRFSSGERTYKDERIDKDEVLDILDKYKGESKE